MVPARQADVPGHYLPHLTGLVAGAPIGWEMCARAPTDTLSTCHVQKPPGGPVDGPVRSGRGGGEWGGIHRIRVLGRVALHLPSWLTGSLASAFLAGVRHGPVAERQAPPLDPALLRQKGLLFLHYSR